MGLEQREKLLPLVREKALKYNLDYKLLDAIIQVESSYNIYAVRFEAKSKSFVIPSKFAKINFITDETEEMLQKFSWGICQVMGSTARWLGYQGPIPHLCNADTNLNWACRFISRLKDQHGVIENIIASYNAGSVRRKPDGSFINQAYVNKVVSVMSK